VYEVSNNDAQMQNVYGGEERNFSTHTKGQKQNNQ
jgi:hypothetical protein